MGNSNSSSAVVDGNNEVITEDKDADSVLEVCSSSEDSFDDVVMRVDTLMKEDGDEEDNDELYEDELYDAELCEDELYEDELCEDDVDDDCFDYALAKAESSDSEPETGYEIKSFDGTEFVQYSQEGYPNAYLVTIVVHDDADITQAEEAEYGLLMRMHADDLEFKRNMIEDKDMQSIYLSIFDGRMKATEYQEIPAKMDLLASIEGGVLKRMEFAKKQNDFVDKLSSLDKLANKEKAIRKARKEKERVLYVASKWDTENIKQALEAM
ncbi:MAG: hypothetical protein SGARI_006360 [Bacillariaceae sp.]